jgi:hypothetical protein
MLSFLLSDFRTIAMRRCCKAESRTPLSGKMLSDHTAFHIAQSKVSTAIVVSQTFGIESHQHPQELVGSRSLIWRAVIVIFPGEPL